ncbi:Anthranilate synthase component 1 [bioreactor metagenome]|uniref:Anthranilate synthase component 1 n=1 Tax=bioreactor metagenome TaxID=1076179 RepID=A0A645H2P5_9ZZZZ
MLVKMQKDRVYTCPIAGTRKRGKDFKEDKLLAEDLLSDEKEKAEHVMLVDLARNDMGKVCKIGSIKLSEFMEVKNYSHVMHLVSTVEGERDEKKNAFDILSSILPAGTLSGAPKIRAMEIIEELENEKRGLYGGAVGYFGFDGNMDMCIAIRMMVVKNRKAYIQSGAGIVADSVPENEYEETQNKAKALIKILGGDIG